MSLRNEPANPSAIRGLRILPGAPPLKTALKELLRLTITASFTLAIFFVLSESAGWGQREQQAPVTRGEKLSAPPAGTLKVTKKLAKPAAKNGRLPRVEVNTAQAPRDPIKQAANDPGLPSSPAPESLSSRQLGQSINGPEPAQPDPAVPIASDQSDEIETVAATPPGKTADEALRAEIEVRLARAVIGKDGFRIQVKDGIAYWDGTTEIAQHKGAATRMARSAGAIEVVNRIVVGSPTIVPVSSTPETEVSLRRAVVQWREVPTYR